MFLGKMIFLGVTGSILSYKAIELAKYLVNEKADVHVIMSENAKKFLNPLIFESITGNKCITDVFDGSYILNVQKAPFNINPDLMVIAPTSANSISRLSRGMSDDALTKTVLSCGCPKLLVPALSYQVMKNPIVQDNMDILSAYGFDVILPDMSKPFSINSSHEISMAENEMIIAYIERYLWGKRDLDGKKVLITSGPTRETLSPLEFITGPSTGKTGYMLAKACMLRGAEVTLITGKTYIKAPKFINIVEAISAKDMFLAVSKIHKDFDIIIDASRVVEYCPTKPQIHSSSNQEEMISVEMIRNPSICSYVSKHRRQGQFLCALSIETQNIMERARRKLTENNLDMVLASNLKSIGSSLLNDTNIMTVITKGTETQLARLSKEETAHKIIDQILMEINL